MLSTKEKLQKELIKSRTTNNETKRQIIRKKLEKSSRKLDGYYNPKIHKKIWQTSGYIHKKNQYIYNDTGLGYNLNNENNIKKINNLNNKKIKIPQTHFVEFDYLQNNEVIIIIEHCSNCEEHLIHTHHINDIYKHISNIIKIVFL